MFAGKQHRVAHGKIIPARQPQMSFCTVGFFVPDYGRRHIHGLEPCPQGTRGPIAVLETQEEHLIQKAYRPDSFSSDQERTSVSEGYFACLIVTSIVKLAASERLRKNRPQFVNPPGAPDFFGRFKIVNLWIQQADLVIAFRDPD